MPRSRDRHGRGIRGPLARPHPWSSEPVPLRRPNRTEFFADCVTQAIESIEQRQPDALRGIEVGVEDVPLLTSRWSGDRVPMAAGLEGLRGKPSRIVVYQRPLERRAASRSDLRLLVARTIIEQLSALTGRPISELTDDTDWD